MICTKLSKDTGSHYETTSQGIIYREKVTITNCDISTAIEAFKRGLERDSLQYDELTKYSCRTMDDVQAKAMAQVRLEDDKRGDDDKYYHPSRKITTPKVRDYNPTPNHKRRASRQCNSGIC